ncbi:MAG: hypothetical protein WCP39_06735 [Chlamydiota bacterium]
MFILTEKTNLEHLDATITQLRLFNETIPIYVITPPKTSQNHPKRLDVIYIPLEKLKKTTVHQKYLHHIIKNPANSQQISENFFCLESLIIQRHLHNVFYLDDNVLIYTDLSKLLPVFKKNYPGMAASFDNEERCQPSFIFISNRDSLKKCTEFLFEQSKRNTDPKKALFLFKNKYGKNTLDSLPILTEEYFNDHSSRIFSNQIVRKKDFFFNNIKQFGSLFDPALMGKFIESSEKENRPDAVFQPSYCKISFEEDKEGRKIPFLNYKDKKIPINNLFVSEKNMEKYLSRSPVKEKKQLTTKLDYDSHRPKK